MKIILSNHAKQRMIERRITLSQIRACIENPSYKITKENKIEMFKEINNKILRIICTQENKFIKVITLM